MLYYRVIYDHMGLINIVGLEKNFIPLNLSSSGNDESGNKYTYACNEDGSYIRIFLTLEEAINYINENFDYSQITEQYRTNPYYWRFYTNNDGFLDIVQLTYDQPNYNYLYCDDGTIHDKFFSYEDALEYLNDYFLRECIDPKCRTLRNILAQKIETCVLCKKYQEQFFIREMCYPCLKKTLDIPINE